MSMQTVSNNPFLNFRSSVVSKGELLISTVLLVGVIIMGYGYFRQNKASLYVGLVVIFAGILTGVLQILTRDNK